VNEDAEEAEGEGEQIGDAPVAEPEEK